MIAAVRRRAKAVLAFAEKRTREIDRAAARQLERLRPVLVRWVKRARARAAKLWATAKRRARPVGVLVLRGFARGERLLRRASAVLVRSATRASAMFTPRRAICAVILASAVCLAVAQFVSFRSVEVGQPGYSGLPVATPPTVGAKTAGEASAYVLVAVAALAAVAGAMALRPGRRGLARAVVVLGIVAVAVILVVDLPAGLDAGAQTSRFSGATAVLEPAFYAQLAAAAGLVLGGALLNWQPRQRRSRARRHRYRPRKPSLARTQGGSAKRAHLFSA